MKETIGWLLIGLFVALALLVIVPSILVLKEDLPKADIPTPPSAPVAEVLPAIDPKGNLELQAKIYGLYVTRYTEQVKAFDQQTAAYEKYLDAYKNYFGRDSRLKAVYELVVKNTLLPFLTAIVTAFLGYVFAKAAANVLNNRARAKANQAIQPFTLF